MYIRWLYPLVAFACLTLGNPLTHEPSHKRAQRPTLPVTGVTEDGEIGVRQEVRALAQNADQWNLFLLGLHYFQKTDASLTSSFHQITGIHGVPPETWDGAEPDPEAVEQGAIGYAPHNSTTFPVWHRAYVALYEQAWYDSVLKVVDGFSGAEKARYQKAAVGLRHPFWDWAAPFKDGMLPKELISLNVTVNDPYRGQISITNPIYEYRLRKLNEAAESEAADGSHEHNPCPMGQTLDESGTKCVSSSYTAARSIGSKTFMMLLHCMEWLEVADYKSIITSKGCPGGLEFVHNDIHNLMITASHVGMTGAVDLVRAGLDPIFFFQHANVDRFLAIWQALHPGVWVTEGRTVSPIYTLKAESIADGNTGLAPFHKDTNGNMFTGNDVEDITIFRYTYPELQNNPSREELISAIERLYGTDVVAPR